jgi:diadenosine tetraphosphate (Ap4A) HIT family hydrolase
MKFDKELLVLETRQWYAIVHPDDQLYLGRLVVVLNYPCGRLSRMHESEYLSFRQVVYMLESALSAAFGATMFNWCCLMNNAYQEENPQPHVHWHFRPRYRNPVEFEGQVFTDPNFGHHYLNGPNDKRAVDRETLKKIAHRIRTVLQKQA